MQHSHAAWTTRGLVPEVAAARYLRPRSLDLEIRGKRRGRAAVAGRYVAALGTGFALAAAPGTVAVVAAATTSSSTGITSGGDTPTQRTETAPSAGITTGGDTPTTTTSTTTSTNSTPTPPPPVSTPAPPSTTPAPRDEPRSVYIGLGQMPQHPGERQPLAPVKVPAKGHAKTRAGHSRPSRHEPVLPAKHVESPKRVVTPAAPPGSTVLTVWDAGFSIDPFTASQLARFSTLVANFDQPPAFLIPTYKAAGRQYGIPWQILAAINAVETDYGHDLAISPTGAIGWMQFMPATWLEYGATPGGHLGNPYDPHDAIFAAARLLAANGAPFDMPRALFAYNHALWYVDAVLWRAQTISDHAVAADAPAATNGYALPLDAKYMAQLGRTDDGVDIEDAPDGTAVYSMTPGVVTAVASDPGGFGPDYPVILVTEGPLAGQSIYYGHVAASLVRVGQQVVAGEPIAVMGHTGNAASLGHGHIEIGFSDGSGDPLNHGGPAAWTPSGDAMRHVLVALAAAFGLKVL